MGHICLETAWVYRQWVILHGWYASISDDRAGLAKHIPSFLCPVYKQTGKLTFDEPKIGLVGAGRSNSRAWEFAAKYNHGNPVAGNFMEVQYDDRISYLFSRLK